MFGSLPPTPHWPVNYLSSAQCLQFYECKIVSALYAQQTQLENHILWHKKDNFVRGTCIEGGCKQT